MEKKISIGIAGPVTLKMLDYDWNNITVTPPPDIDSPLIAVLANALKNFGHKVVIYTSSAMIDKEIVYEGENMTICIAKRPKKPTWGVVTLYFQERRSMSKLMRKYPTDIINAQWSYEFALSAMDSGITTVTTIHDVARVIYQFFKDRYRIMRWIVNNIVLWKSKYLIANSEYTFNNLTPQQQKRSIIVPNYYSEHLEKLYTPHIAKKNYIISVCNFEESRKNVPNALHAFKIIKQYFPDIQYYLVGFGMNTQGVYYANQHGLAENVVFIGTTPFSKVLELVRNAKVMLHSSREESFGLSVLEAMVVGTPVVGGDKSGNIPYLLKQRQTGIVCDVENPQAIAEAVMELLSNEQLSQEITENAHQFAKENFSMNVVIPKLIQHYEEILKKENKL